MKKSLMLLIATALVAFMTGCGGGGSSAKSKKSSVNVTGGTQTDSTFTVEPTDSGANVTYKTTAKGSLPPAPPSSSLEKAQEEANAKLKTI